MSTPDQRYREKMAARAEGRAPVISIPVAFPAEASADERYRAKLAARRAHQSGQALKAESKAEEAPTEPKPADAVAEPMPAQADPKADSQSRQDNRSGNRR